MIYTVTFNPSLDYIVEVPGFELGMTNRTVAEQMFPGGKGINVSMVLQNLGHKSIALGFLAGFVGREIERCVVERGVESKFIALEEGNARINVKLKNVDGTEINGMGPAISKKAMDELLAQLDALVAGDMLVLAGSIPKTISDTIYMDIMKRLAGKGIEVVVDATKELLMNVLPYNPFLIKPNHHELGEIFGVKIESQGDVLPYAKKLQEMGAKNVLVSMGGMGAVLLAEDGSHYALDVPKGTLVNAVGAGDSMVAGFIAGCLEKSDYEHTRYEHAFKMGVATGSASAFSENLATKCEVVDLYSTL